MIRTPEQYLKSLNDGRNLYYNGERIPDPAKHPLLRRQCTAHVIGYYMCNHPKYRDKFTTMENGERILFLWNQPKTVEDMIRRGEIYELMHRFDGYLNAVAVDVIAAAGLVATKMDKEIGTHYMDAVEDYRAHCKKTDPAMSGCVTDIKGDRSLRPSAQVQHKDFYVHVVDRQKDGIVIRGAKIFISGSDVSNETIIQPSRTHREEDKDYCVVGATPLNAKGITMLVSPPDFFSPDDEETQFDWPDTGPMGGHSETMIVFDNVFIPWNRVFMCGEWQYGRDIARTFGKLHRLAGTVIRTTNLERLVGSAALMAEYNGLEKYSHIQEKLAWLTCHLETVVALNKAGCAYPDIDAETGLPMPNDIYVNAAKYKAANDAAEASKMAADICGGIISCVPNYKDWTNPTTKPLIDKYMASKAGIPTEYRLRAARLMKNMTDHNYDQATIHGAGSLMTQRIMMYAGADWEKYKATAKRVAGIPGWETHPLYKGFEEFTAENIWRKIKI